MLADYGYIGLFLIVVILFAVTTLLLPFFLSFIRIVPKKPNPIKNSTYECGMETIGKSWVQFNFRYYYYALIFLVLDVLIVFLYPWAVDIRQLGSSGFIGVLILVFIVIVGYVYAWRKKVLEWK